MEEENLRERTILRHLCKAETSVCNEFEKLLYEVF